MLDTVLRFVDLELDLARGELVDHLHDRKHFLFAWTVTATRLLAFVRLVLGARSPLGRVTEKRLRAARKLLLQVRDLGMLAERVPSPVMHRRLVLPLKGAKRSAPQGRERLRVRPARSTAPAASWSQSPGSGIVRIIPSCLVVT